MRWLQSHERPRDADKSLPKEPSGGSPVLELMAHEVYRVVLFGVFYLQVSLLGYVPYIGESFATTWLSLEEPPPAYSLACLLLIAALYSAPACVTAGTVSRRTGLFRYHMRWSGVAHLLRP